MPPSESDSEFAKTISQVANRQRDKVLRMVDRK